MRWPIREVLLVPAVDWRHVAWRRLGRGTKLPAPIPRLASSLGYLLEKIVAAADTATIGFFGETIRSDPELVRQVVAAGCEIAVMTDDEIDPWSLTPAGLRHQVLNAVDALNVLGLTGPFRFLPPFPDNRRLDPARVTALREAGIRQTLGCGGDGLPALWLAEWHGRPLAGAVVRFVPVRLMRWSLTARPGTALALSPIDADPGAPLGGSGRSWMLQKLPKLLRTGFVSAELLR